jgi:hypothetical protein
MSTLFDDLVHLLNAADGQKQRNSQRQWLKERLNCGDDFLCTKTAYTERIEHLNVLLTKVKTNSGVRQAATECRVSDPNPPLNVRTASNGKSKIVGQLPNGTMVLVLDFSPNKSWAFVGKSKDRSPVGWVFSEYIECQQSLGVISSSSFACYLIKQFPEPQQQEKDPVVATTVIVPNGGQPKIEVLHRLASGEIHKRNDQYRDIRTTVRTGEDSVTWSWTGILAINNSLSMKGELTGGEGQYSYSEQLTAKGKLDWVALWSCREQESPVPNLRREGAAASPPQSSGPRSLSEILCRGRPSNPTYRIVPIRPNNEQDRD